MSETVPEGWRINSIDECCEILDSQRIPLNSEERSKRLGEYPYYGANGIQGYIDDFIFDGDAILVAEDGGNFDQYAERPIAQWVTGKYWVNNHAHILKAKENDLDKWIFYSLVHKNILKFINGGTRAKLNQSDLREIQIYLPPLPEQKKIASILTSVDEVIENTQKQIDKLQDLKKATMNELLTKGIGHTEFKDSELGRIPKTWDVKRLVDVLEIKHGFQFRDHHFSNDGIPIIKIGNLRDGGEVNLSQSPTFIPREKFSEFQKFKLRKSDTLMALTGATLGKVSIFNHDLDALQNYRVGKFISKKCDIFFE
jgi:type I restriction enzyme S subunit